MYTFDRNTNKLTSIRYNFINSELSHFLEETVTQHLSLTYLFVLSFLPPFHLS